MRITLEPWVSKAFPVLASWKIGKCKSSEVFTSKEEAISYLSGRFGKIEIIDGGKKS